jgi:hypothetical protein
LLALRSAYRDDVAEGAVKTASRVHLEAASDALSMALLTLSGDDDDRGDKYRRAAQARGFLAEALTSLSRARIYMPGIRTHSLPVLMSTDSDPDAELQRLHQIATRMLWQNHIHLPARLQAKPLAPEEEAQLAVVLAGLARSARIERALRYKWAGLTAAAAGASAVLGLPALGFAAAIAAVSMVAWRMAKDRPARAVSPA